MGSEFLYNNKTLKDCRRELRRNQTPAEKKIWTVISIDKIFGLRFLRQYGVGPYILDFYCLKLCLAIEVDGDVHVGQDAQLYDKDREEYLKTLDIKVIRFRNGEVLLDILGVKTKIQNTVKNKMDS